MNRIVIDPALRAVAKTQAKPVRPGTVQVSVSRGKKRGNARSKFLSELMKRSSGDLGNSLAEAYVGGDADAFAKSFDKLKSSILNTIHKNGKQ